MNEARARCVVIVLGAPLSGKTTIARGLLKDLRANAGEDKRPIAILDPGGQFGGGFMPAANDVQAWLEVVRPPTNREAAKVRAVVFDDGDSYLASKPPKGSAELDLYLRHRWWRTDVVVTARRPQNLSPVLWSAAELAFVFRTNPADRTARERLEEFAPGIDVPSEQYFFVCRNLYTGAEFRGRTKRNGGFEAA